MSKPELSCLDSENATAASALPLARIKRIVNVDDDVNRCSSDANFLIAVATELFIQYLVKQTSTVLKADRKARRTIQYKDVVSRIDTFEFLTDVVPRPDDVKKGKRRQGRVAYKGKMVSTTAADEEDAESQGHLRDPAALSEGPSAADEEQASLSHDEMTTRSDSDGAEGDESDNVEMQDADEL